MAHSDDIDIMTMLRECLDLDISSDIAGFAPAQPHETILGCVPEKVRGLFIFAISLERANSDHDLIDSVYSLFRQILQMHIPVLAEYNYFDISENWGVVGFNAREEEQGSEETRIFTSMLLH